MLGGTRNDCYTVNVLRAGGDWDDGVHCGSLNRDADDLRSNVNGNDGARGSIRVLVLNSGAELKFKLTRG